MLTIDQIKEFARTMKEERHGDRLREQNEDMDFFKNEYPLKLIKKPDYQMRTNFAARMINAITQQLISKEPKLYVTARKADNDLDRQAAMRLSVMGNKWIHNLLKYPINPIEQTFKDFNVLGDSWIYTPHNPLLVDYDGEWEEYDMMPVHFIKFDPRIVFSDPSEEIDGEPSRVSVICERTVGNILHRYPKWAKGQGENLQKPVSFLLYFDKEQSYAEADGESLFRNKKSKMLNGTGQRGNPYGCVPFVHFYSGWGFDTQEKNPADLSYSRIRMLRSLITEDSQVRSDQLYNFHSKAHQSKTMYLPAGSEIAPDWADAYKNDPDKLNVIRLPEGADPSWFRVDETELFSADAYAYADRIRADLSMEFPLPLRGGAAGSSGRQDDLLRSSGLSIYECAVKNTSALWEKAFAKAFKILSAIDMLPKGINRTDLDRYKELTFDLRTENKVERDREINMGSVLVNEGKRSLKTFLMKDMRMTEEEADEEIDNILVEKYMYENPEIVAFIGSKVAEKSGMADELAAFRQQRGEAEQFNLGSKIGSKGGERRSLNIKTQQGREMADVALTSTGQRSPAQEI